MHKLQSVVLPHGPATSKTTKMRLKNFNVEFHLNADCRGSRQARPKRARQMVSLLPENVSFEAGLEQEGSVVTHYRTFALAANYQLIQNRREHAGDRRVESMELVEKEEGMKTRSFGVDAKTGQFRSPAYNNQPTKQQEIAQKSEAEVK